jgi:hypothetical protein
MVAKMIIQMIKRDKSKKCLSPLVITPYQNRDAVRFSNPGGQAVMWWA